MRRREADDYRWKKKVIFDDLATFEPFARFLILQSFSPLVERLSAEFGQIIRLFFTLIHRDI